MTAWTSAWHDALDALDLDVAAAEDLLRQVHLMSDGTGAGAHVFTTLPTDLGPLPSSLADRARGILARQLQVAEELTRAMGQNRQHRRAAASMFQRPAAVPVYVDTAV